MVVHLGECSNHFEELFTELERWEVLLRALPDFPVDGAEDPPHPPG